jgi:hypothetical protein
VPHIKAPLTSDLHTAHLPVSAGPLEGPSAYRVDLGVEFAMHIERRKHSDLKLTAHRVKGSAAIEE